MTGLCTRTVNSFVIGFILPFFVFGLQLSSLSHLSIGHKIIAIGRLHRRCVPIKGNVIHSPAHRSAHLPAVIAAALAVLHAPIRAAAGVPLVVLIHPIQREGQTKCQREQNQRGSLGGLSSFPLAVCNKSILHGLIHPDHNLTGSNQCQSCNGQTFGLPHKPTHFRFLLRLKHQAVSFSFPTGCRGARGLGSSLWTL
nr:MAG TPA: hypothetical protein [Caudoviricetes sp.]